MARVPPSVSHVDSNEIVTRPTRSGALPPSIPVVCGEAPTSVPHPVPAGVQGENSPANPGPISRTMREGAASSVIVSRALT